MNSQISKEKDALASTAPGDSEAGGCFSFSEAPTEEATETGALTPQQPPEAETAAPPPEEKERKRLERELGVLQEALCAAKEELRQLSERKQMLELFPELAEEAIPDEVIAMTRENAALPLPAAYALYRCRQERRKRLAAEEAEKNRLRSSGCVRSDGKNESGQFSLAEISAMSRAEVKRNYRDILRSLAGGK